MTTDTTAGASRKYVGIDFVPLATRSVNGIKALQHVAGKSMGQAERREAHQNFESTRFHVVTAHPVRFWRIMKQLVPSKV